MERVLCVCCRYACVIALQATLHNDPQQTWMAESYYNLCSPVSGADLQLLVKGPDKFSQGCPWARANVGAWYISAAAWSVMVITGTGGTDFYPSSMSVGETALVTVLVFLGAILWTQVLAQFCDVATNSNPAETHFRQTLDDFNTFCAIHDVPKEMQLRMREYLHATKRVQLRQATSHAIETLSPAMQVEVILFVNRNWLRRIWFLTGADEPCIVQIATGMEARVYAPGEVVPLRNLYVIEKGMVLTRGRVLTSGDAWGMEDVMLPDTLLHYAPVGRARSLSFLDVRCLSRDLLIRVTARFPRTQWLIRRAAILYALRRFLRMAVAYVKEHPETKADGWNGLVQAAASITGVPKATHGYRRRRRSVSVREGHGRPSTSPERTLSGSVQCSPRSERDAASSSGGVQWPMDIVREADEAEAAARAAEASAAAATAMAVAAKAEAAAAVARAKSFAAKAEAVATRNVELAAANAPATRDASHGDAVSE